MDSMSKSKYDNVREKHKKAATSSVNFENVHRRQRAKRYVESPDDPQIFKSKTLNDLRPYYAGDFMDSRMESIRESIVYIRKKWKDYDKFSKSLLAIFNCKDEDFDRVMTTRKDWTLPANDDERGGNPFGLIRLYTSEDGYHQIFSVLNKILRKEDSVETNDFITSAVFLIELINIELFQYCIYSPKYADFQDIVYRGIALTEQDLQAFINLGTMDIKTRNIGVPLSLMSTSSDIESVKDYLISEVDENPDLKLLMMKIHVIALKPEYLQYYKDKYPSSVVSTICAVDIHEISHFPDEREVILRGAFFQVLRIVNKVEYNEEQYCHMVEMVMLNANRDHISTDFLGENDAPARELFKYMNIVTRLEFCMDFYSKNNMTKEEKEVDVLLPEAREKLLTLMI